jgi:hypothetical protein
VTDDIIDSSGTLSLIGEQWVFDPTYTWNIAMPMTLSTDGYKDYLVEEVYSDRPAQEWYDDIIVSKIKNGKIFNYTGRRLRVANQRGVVFIDTTDVEVPLPASLFDEKVSYDPQDCRPGDYIIKWRIGEGRYNIARVVGRRRDDIRHPIVLVNGKEQDPSQWRIAYEGGVDAYTTPVLGIKVLGLASGDVVDIVANGSMLTSVNRNVDITPSRIAIDGTTITNLLKPYLR